MSSEEVRRFFAAVQSGDQDAVLMAYGAALTSLEGDARRNFKRACYFFLYGGGSNEDRADDLPRLVQ